MAILPLTAAQRSSLRADAHGLSPVVMIGDAGLTEAVVKETDAALSAHHLIKVRVFADEKDVRAEYFDQLCDQLGAAQVQHIGKLLVLYRPESATPRKKTFAQTLAGDDGFKGAAPRRVTVVKSAIPNRAVRTKEITIKGNERVTQSGNVKRAKKKVVSAKKKMG
ncbi:MAG: YhbY family RNA-binding protein [Formosimonas sp.]